MINVSQQKSIFVSFVFKSYNSMKTLAKYHVRNHCAIGEKTFKNILTGPGKSPGLSRNGPLAPLVQHLSSSDVFFEVLVALSP